MRWGHLERKAGVIVGVAYFKLAFAGCQGPSEGGKGETKGFPVIGEQRHSWTIQTIRVAQFCKRQLWRCASRQMGSGEDKGHSPGSRSPRCSQDSSGLCTYHLRFKPLNNPQKQALLFSFSRGGHRGAVTVGSLFKFALRDWTVTITQAG